VAGQLGRRKGIARDHVEREKVRYRRATIRRDCRLIASLDIRSVSFGQRQPRAAELEAADLRALRLFAAAIITRQPDRAVGVEENCQMSRPADPFHDDGSDCGAGPVGRQRWRRRDSPLRQQ
jgi:hypothetical protein